jgi:hypothetical protein
MGYAAVCFQAAWLSVSEPGEGVSPPPTEQRIQADTNQHCAG